VLRAAGITEARPHEKAGPDADPLAGVIVADASDPASFNRRFIDALRAGRQWTRGLKPPVVA